MALFSRRVRIPTTAPDSEFTFWDGPTADLFRTTVRQEFASAGRETEVFADHIRDNDGNVFGLWNLAAQCRDEKPGSDAWRELVSEHVRRLIRPSSDVEIRNMSVSEVLAVTYRRVIPSDSAMPWMSHARSVAPGLHEVLTIDLPETVKYLNDDDVARYGYEALQHAGTANLRGIRPDERGVLSNGACRFDVLFGESFFTASLILILEDSLAREDVHIDPVLGAFVAVPNRHQLAFHVLEDMSASGALQAMVGFAAFGHRDSPGQLSSTVFWWRPATIAAVASASDEGTVTESNPDLEAVLHGLGCS